MNGKNSIIEQNQKQQLQEQTNEKKIFVQDIFNINYQNTSKIYYQQSAHSSDVKVNNYLCYQEGQNLYKVTEIIYEDKLIRIQDKFEVNIDPEQLKTKTVVSSVRKEKSYPKNIEKVRIFSKDAKKNGKVQKKDKKNIVKNIVKIFISWLQKKNSQKVVGPWDIALSQLKKTLEQQNFNNRLIKNIVNNKDINKSFLAFLTDDAQDEIKYSRIQDKQSHYQAIELYISLLGENHNGQKISQWDNSRSMNQRQRNNMSSEDNEENQSSENNSIYQSQSQNNLQGRSSQNNQENKIIRKSYRSNHSNQSLNNDKNHTNHFNHVNNHDGAQSSNNGNHTESNGNNGNTHRNSHVQIQPKKLDGHQATVLILHPQKHLKGDDTDNAKSKNSASTSNNSHSNSNSSSNSCKNLV